MNIQYSNYAIPAYRRFRKSTRKGQLLVMFGLFMLFLIMGFFALAVDFTMIYHTKAKLSRTVDAVALRIVNRYSKNHSDSDRQRIAESIFEGNFALLKNTGTTITWAWASDGRSISSTLGETITGSGTDASGTEKYKLVINTKADSNTGVVVSDVTGTAVHDTLLLPFFSSDYEEFTFTEDAEAERFPSVNAVIIDVSGSMRSNGGAVGISGTGTTDGAVVQFVNEFDEERDYMLVVSFSNGAKVVWPTTMEGTDYHATHNPNGSGLPFFEPTRNFLTTGDANGKTVKDVIENEVAYSGWTNGAEGLRVAAKHIQLWLDNEDSLQSETVRNKIKVNYVFMTDGENNTYRTYVRGYGYGVTSSGGNDYTEPTLSIHNSFHRDWPLVIEDESDLDGTLYETYDLGDLLHGANVPGTTGPDTRPEQVAGIATNVNTNRISDGNDNRYARTQEEYSTNATTDYNNYQDWTALLIKGSSANLDARTAELLLFDRNIRDDDDADDNDVDASDYVLDSDIDREKGRTESSYFTQIPRTLTEDTVADFMNPGKGHDYYAAAGSANNPTVYSTLDADTQTEVSGSNTYYYITRGTATRYYFLSQAIYNGYEDRYDNIADDDVKMTNTIANYFPMGEVYANHQGSFVEDNGGGTLTVSESLTPHIFKADSNKRRLFVTQRISDFYPEYHFDGAPKSGRWSTSDDDDDDHESQRYAYSWRNGGDWDDVDDVSERNECDFLAGAQAKILRLRDDNDVFKYQDATVYTIRYGSSGNGNLLKEMANDPNEYSSYIPFPTENEGLYYDVSASSAALQAAFKDIASRIAVRISR
ncbi:MAG: TadE/TadG family type IV pilus assembly protein [Verrucomicrobiota bacterium]